MNLPNSSGLQKRMPYASGLMNELGPLSAYGEYTEEVPPSSQPREQKASTVPVNRLSEYSGVQPLSVFMSSHSADKTAWLPAGMFLSSSYIGDGLPVLMSLGYSSSHWCSIMSRDCWSDAETAGLVNDTCIPVLCDREEYPDADAILTEICRTQNGSSGYPLNIFMMPDKRPFMCVTWLPKRTMGQMTGLTEIMPRIKWLWTAQREDVERAANNLAGMVKERFDMLAGRKSSSRMGRLPALQAVNDMRTIFDVRWGGFGISPKLPEHDKMIFLLTQADPSSGASKRDISDALTMTDITLRRMWRGGIHDHLGGGFFTSSNDAQWLVPHFEKLLGDNALILLAASMSQRLNPNSFHRLLAEDVIFCLTHYFADDASHSQGFRSSVDGDTDEGEGRYYLWNEDEIRRLLPDDAGLFCAAYAVLPSGNFGSELAGSQMSWNILYEASTVTELARRYALKGHEVASRLYEARRVLLDYRDKRYPLRAENKVIMNWNGLAIGALAHASVSFEAREWLDIAERTAIFITRNFANKSGGWFRSWIGGKSYIPATLDDIACLLWGIIELYKACVHFGAGEKQLGEWLEVARKLADYMTGTFADEKNGGLFMTAGEVLGYRFKSPEDYNSSPSGNALAAIALDELAFMAEDRKYSDFARGIIGCFARYVKDNPLRCLTMITADLLYKPFKPKKKPEPEPVHVPTDEELNREEVQEQAEPTQDERKPRSSRRSHQEIQQGRNERASRRASRTHRTRER